MATPPARRQLGVPITEQEQEFDDFQEWIEQRFNQPSTQSWTRIILFYSEDEADALNRFFELFEDFLNRDKHLDVAYKATLALWSARFD